MQGGQGGFVCGYDPRSLPQQNYAPHHQHRQNSEDGNDQRQPCPVVSPLPASQSPWRQHTGKTGNVFRGSARFVGHSQTVGWNEKPVFFVLSGKHEAALASNRLEREGNFDDGVPYENRSQRISSQGVRVSIVSRMHE